MHNVTRSIRILFLELFIVLGMMTLHLDAVLAELDPPAMPGMIQGTGTSFMVTDSDYLNVSVTSTAEIDLYLNSRPTIIDMTIAAAAGAISTDMTVGGLDANTTYWMYQDASADGVEFTTDASGNYSFTLDLLDPNNIRIQAGQSTVRIYDDGAGGTGGDCTNVGIWDTATKTCTLNKAVNDYIFIYDPQGTNVGVTLEGNGQEITVPSGATAGVIAYGKNHTIQNLDINGFIDPTYGLMTNSGVYLGWAESVTVTNVTVSNTIYGLRVYNYCLNSMIISNTFSGVDIGAFLPGAYYDQDLCESGDLYYCGTSNNIISNNSFSPFSEVHGRYGMGLSNAARHNTIRGNTFTGFHTGFYTYDRNCVIEGAGSRWCPDGNIVYQNNFISNYRQINAGWGAASTTYNLPAPHGGNYYNDFDDPAEGCDDINTDGFCDSGYPIFNINNVSIFDNLPWMTRDGWLNEQPIAEAGNSQSALVGQMVYLDGTGSFDTETSTEDLVYAWSFTQVPSGSTATLLGANTATPSFLLDQVGDYVVSLVVTDEGDSTSSPDTVTVSSLNAQPNADAGPSQSTYVGDIVLLDGSGSSDPDGHSLQFTWRLNTPIDSNTTLSGENTVQPNFVPDTPGEYIAELIVYDGYQDSEADTVSVLVSTVEDYASEQIGGALVTVAELPLEDVTTTGNQTALEQLVKQAWIKVDQDNNSQAIAKLQQAIERTDGCILRGSPDAGYMPGSTTPPPAKDHILDCVEQAVVFHQISEALEALME